MHSKLSLLPARRPRVLLAALALSAAVLGTGCGDISITFNGDGADAVKGSGVSASETRAVAGFNAIEASGSGRVKLRVGGDESLKIIADDNVLPVLTSEVRNGVLVLSTKSGIKPKTDIVYEIGAKAIKRLENAGTVSIEASGFNGGTLELETSGVGSATLSGRVDSLKVELSGVGSVDAENLQADSVKAEMSGVGNGKVYAEKSLRAEVSGVGNLTWKGGATDVNTTVSGIGRVSKG